MDMPLYPDDIVASKADDQQLAVVERTHDDVDSHAFPLKAETHPIKYDRTIPRDLFHTFMEAGVPPEGTVLVRWQKKENLELMPALKLTLLDRSLLIGDIVKRNVSDAISGVVLNTFTRCTLQPMSDVPLQESRKLKGILPPGDYELPSPFAPFNADDRSAQLVDIPASELVSADRPTEADLVIYKDWVGRVDAVVNNIYIRLIDNCVVEIADELGEHVDGQIGSFYIGDIARTKKKNLREGHWIYGEYNANTPPVGTVVLLRTVGAEITWLQRRIGSPEQEEPMAELEADELDSSAFRIYDRSKRPCRAHGGADPTSETVSNSELDVRLNLRVRFRDLDAACSKYCHASSSTTIPRLDRRENLGYDLNVFDVTSFRTNVTVQWQDLSITTEDSVQLVPDGSIDDEHAAWPSEIAHSLDMHPAELGGTEMPGRVGIIQSVNARERMAKIRWCPQSFIHYSEEKDADGGPPTVLYSKIDSTASTAEDVSLYDIEAPAALNVRRGDIVLIALQTIVPRSAPEDVDWLGEIVDTQLDGKLLVRLGAAQNIRDVEFSRDQCVVAIRSDGTDLPDEWEDGGDVAFGDSDVSGEMDSYDGSDWDVGVPTGAEIKYEDEDGNAMDEQDVEDEAWESADDADDTNDVAMTDAPSPLTPLTLPNAEKQTDISSVPRSEQGTSGPGQPEPYVILDSEVPLSHHFRNEPATTTPAHVRRTQKEHKILRNPSTLPEGVYIRAWESRLDLLRILLVGPTETPYAHAPFVVDFYLPPSFPTEPPQAFFHSWPVLVSIGGIGRVNPNLYEDGKICLSILGTWDGSKSEGWSAARSTLLQVVVSLLGLVLVREPYYNEAGYEPLRGSEATKRPSALYSERIFLRSKGFLITALSGMPRVAETPLAPGLQGLVDVVSWLYYDADGPNLLRAMAANVETVLKRSEEGEGEPDGLTLMSKGACIPLRRVLDRLQELLSQSLAR